MDNNNDVIDSNYVDPNLLAQYAEEEKANSRKYMTSTPAPTNYTPNDNQTMLEKILEQAVAVEASDVHLLCGCQPLLRVSKELQYIQ